MTEIADVPAWDIPFSSEEYDQRLVQVRRRMESLEVHALLLTEPSDIFYLTGYDTQGFWAYQALILPADGEMTLVCFIEEILHAEARGLDHAGYAYGSDHVGTSLPPYESPIYSASKGGVLGMTRALACAWARHGIRVDSISPGMFLTHQSRSITGDVAARLVDRTPLGRMGVPDDLAGAALSLASDASSFVTGHNLVVDGGWSVW